MDSSSFPAWAQGLLFGSGLLWAVVYIDIIRRGFQDRSYGMPMTALCANLSWEFLFTFILPHAVPLVFINAVWLLFDVIIAYQFLRFGRSDPIRNLPARLFLPTFLLTLVLCFSAILTLTLEFKDEGRHAAFMQNLLMSVLFIGMLLRRQDVRGQSMYVALSKLLGTVLPAACFLLLFPVSPLFAFLCAGIFIFDVVYVVMLHAKFVELGLNPWTRQPVTQGALAAPPT